MPPSRSNIRASVLPDDPDKIITLCTMGDVELNTLKAWMRNYATRLTSDNLHEDLVYYFMQRIQTRRIIQINKVFEQYGVSDKNKHLVSYLSEIAFVQWCIKDDIIFPSNNGSFYMEHEKRIYNYLNKTT